MPPLDPQAQQVLNQRNGVQAPAQQAQPRPVQPQQRGPVFGPPVVQAPPPPPTPLQIRSENRADVGQNVDISNTAFDNVRAMASDFTALPEVKNYSTVIRQLSSALGAQPNAAGDQSLIVSYARMLDPASVVREGEYDTTAQADNTFGQTVARLQREFGLEGGGLLSDEARRRVLQEMRNLAVNYRRGYEGRVADYKQRAIRAGYDPLDIIGQDLGIPYNAQMREYDERRRAEREGTQGAMGGGGGAQAGTGTGADGDPGNPFPGVFDANGNPLGPEGGTGYDAEGNDLGMFVSVTAEQTADQLVDPKVAQEADQLEQMLGEAGVGKLFQNIAGLGDEAAGAGRVLSEMLFNGDFNIPANYRLGRDVERELIRRARERTGTMGSIAEGVGNLAMAGGNSGSVMRAGRAVVAGGGKLTRGAVQTQMVRNAAREGAIAGAVPGFGYGEGLEGSVTGAVIGATTGATLGGGGQIIGNKLSNRAVAAANPVGARAESLATQQAADRQGIDTIAAMTGGNVSRGVTGGARQGIISDKPISDAVERIQGQGAAARERIATGTGNAVEDASAGEIVRRAANVYSERTGGIGGRLYDRADRMANGTTAPLPEAVQVADRWLAEIAQSPTAGSSRLAGELQGLRDQMANGQFAIPGIRLMRSELRERIQEAGLRGSLSDTVYNEIVQAAERDMINALQSSGRQNAANALKTATDFWRTRVETIDQVLEPVLGRNSPRSGEQIVTALERMASPKSGNEQNLRRLLQAMPRSEADSVRATIIHRLGRPSPGAGEVLDETSFSFEQFLTNWNAMSPRARATAFPRGSIDALNDLATVAASIKRAGQSMNTSNTTRAMGVQAAISGGLFWLEPLTAIGGAAGQYSVGRLLASPRFARWLSGSTRVTNARAQQAYISRLGDIARAEPTLARDLEALRAGLAANDNAALVNNVAAGRQPEDR